MTVTYGTHYLSITFDGVTTTRLCCGSPVGCGQDAIPREWPATLAHLRVDVHPPRMPRRTKKPWNAAIPPEEMFPSLHGREHVPPPKVEAPPPVPSAGLVMSPKPEEKPKPPEKKP